MLSLSRLVFLPCDAVVVAVSFLGDLLFSFLFSVSEFLKGHRIWSVHASPTCLLSVSLFRVVLVSKTLQFVRAPDENVFIPPFNLIELFGLVLPLEWWMPKEKYQQLNRSVMGVIYAPMLLVTAWLETRTARKVNRNRDRHEADDDTVEEWEQLGEDEGGAVDFEADGWAKRVMESKPNVETDAAVLEIRELRLRLEALSKAVEGIKREES